MSDSGSEVDSESRTSATGHNFLTIPPDLAELIFEHVDSPTLVSLRATSRETARLVEKRYLEECFSQRAFLLNSEDSLRALLSIVEIDKLARALKTIDLCIDEIPEPYLTEVELLELNQPTIRGVPNGLEALRTWHLRELYTRYHKQRHDCEQNVDLHLLSVIFSRLRRLNHRPEVRIVDQHEACDCPWSMVNLEFLTRAQLEGTDNRERPVSMVLEAIALSGMPLESLVVRCAEWLWNLNSLTASPTRVLYMKDVFRGLRKLHLMSDHEESVLDEDIEAFFGALKTATLMEDLSLQVSAAEPFRHGSYDDIVDGLYKCLSQNLPKLKCLDLQGYALSLPRIRKIITQHPDLVKVHYHASEELHDAYLDPKYKGSPSELSDHCYMPASSLSNKQYFSWLGNRLIAPCTLLEFAEGRDAWDEKLLELRRIEEEKADAVIEKIMALRAERESLLNQ